MEYFVAFRDNGSVAWFGSGTEGVFASSAWPEGIRAFLCSKQSHDAGIAPVDEIRAQLLELADGDATLIGQINAAQDIAALLSITTGWP